jgi:membrane protease YdiL (CAAX protease family)
VQGTCQPNPAPPDASAGGDVPAWHTALLVALIVLVAVAGSLGFGAPEAPRSRLTQAYVPMMLTALGLSLYVTRLGLSRCIFWQLWGASSRERAVVDVVLALSLSLTVVGAETWLAPAEPNAAAWLLPQSLAEHAVWVMVAVAVGVSEELVYRGYLRRELAKWLSSPWLGNVAQALLFGVAHANQGVGAAARIAAYGLWFGAISGWRAGLGPSALAHVAIDLYAGFSG